MAIIEDMNGKEHYIPNDSIKFVMDEGWYVTEEYVNKLGL